jgi:lipopolysaccharide transport system ATP-binding protein
MRQHSSDCQADHNPALSLHHVGVHYRRRIKVKDGGLWALKDITFDLRHGETLGIIGRNGMGKSTLLRVMSGIIAPDSGKIIHRAGRASLLSLQVGFVAHLTGRENAVVSALLLGLSRREIRSKLDEIIDFAGLGDFIDEPVGNYSSGMRARLGFAVSFHADPDILLIDEVLGVGDAEFKQKSTAAMKARILSDKTVIIVSHNMATIRELCDRVIWLEQGRTLQEGATATVVDAYEHVHSVSHKQQNLQS